MICEASESKHIDELLKSCRCNDVLNDSIFGVDPVTGSAHDGL